MKKKKTPEQYAAEYRQRKSAQYQREHKERAAKTKAYKKHHKPPVYHPAMYQPQVVSLPGFQWYREALGPGDDSPLWKDKS